MAAKDEMRPHPKTGLYPVRILGLPIEGDKDKRAGEAGLGLRVGEVRGVSLDVARTMIAKGTAEYVDPYAHDPDLKGAKPSAPAPAA